MLKSFEPAFRHGHAMGAMAAYHEIDGIPVTADPVLRPYCATNGASRDSCCPTRRDRARLGRALASPPPPRMRSCWRFIPAWTCSSTTLNKTFQHALIDCAHEGSLSKTAFDRAVRSVLRVKFELGLFDHPFVDPGAEHKVYRSPSTLLFRSSRPSSP